ncbi:hypothetical protein D0B54_01875 [Solimonas sp. K1W22B-7]|nr:hypothetical protein D0B54_01875 [Solimonas sp. K1W22B-7]
MEGAPDLQICRDTRLDPTRMHQNCQTFLIGAEQRKIEKGPIDFRALCVIELGAFRARRCAYRLGESNFYTQEILGDRRA